MSGPREGQSVFARRQALAMAAAALGVCASAPAIGQTAESAKERQLREDFPWLARHAEENAKVKASGIRPAIVFMGDSITERWKKTRPAFFSDRRICRGIGGQTTPQMVLRMMADVIALHPRAVHIMGGTNDIAGNTGPMTLDQTVNNIEAMALLAKAKGIAVLIASVPPAAAFRWSPSKTPAEPIRELNRRLKQLARSLGAEWIDYHAALTDPAGGLPPAFATDGVHPIDAGYAVMEKILAPRLARIERGKAAR